MPVLAVTSRVEHWPLFVITFHQNWHHLYSSSVGGKDLCNDTQTAVIGSTELEIICIEIRRNWNENWEQNFPNYTWLLRVNW